MTTPDPIVPLRDDAQGSPVDPPPAAEVPPAQPPAPDSWSVNARQRPANEPSQPGLVAGIVLVVIGVVFLLVRVVDITLGASAWPLWLIVPGLAMLAGSFAIPTRGGLGLAVPGTIIAIVGGILLVQEAYGLWATWAYAWALVAPTGPGLAMLVYGLVRGDRDLMGDGFRTTLVGLALFVSFAFFFEGVVGISGHRIANADQVLPIVAIGLGVLLVVASLFGGGRDRDRASHRDRRGA